MSGAGTYRKEGAKANQDPNSMFGLLPLLSDALAKFKGAIEGIKSENERFESETDGKIVGINKSVESVLDSVKNTEKGFRELKRRLWLTRSRQRREKA